MRALHVSFLLLSTHFPFVKFFDNILGEWVVDFELFMKCVH